MTIDEVIEHARERYNEIINTTYNKCQSEHLYCEDCRATPTCKEIADENLQIAEWLEELKEFKELNSNVIRDSAIDEAMVASAKAICIGCGYRSGTKCTYTGHNCTVSKPMLEVVMKELEKLKRDKI